MYIVKEMRTMTIGELKEVLDWLQSDTEIVVVVNPITLEYKSANSELRYPKVNGEDKTVVVIY